MARTTFWWRISAASSLGGQQQRIETPSSRKGQSSKASVVEQVQGVQLADKPEFHHGEGSGSATVDLAYETDTSNLENSMFARTKLRDRRQHDKLKADLMENIWQKFGYY
ncbi:uncharacterized protein LOC112084638 isoform X1 [Eutrema salsugineum]|uniref:uncharacterized protein LOC112084638 isoform X1 n=1 Tax=Eutrema salsugineum TaxID=72664 RepID=UPI000CECFE41|nr:uncharacterized protein LOC112084638 isoform X1 [Eutrema salsugineum]